MKNKNILKNILYVILFILMMASIFLSGVYYGFNDRPEVEKIFGLKNKEATTEASVDFEPFWKAWSVLNEKSIYSKNTNDQDRVWGAIEGLASSFGDPYTTFFPPEENKMFQEEIQGEFEVIGAELANKADVLTIVAPLKNTPAWNAGIKAGDRILEIDGKSTNGMSSEEAVKMIRGKEGTSVDLTILRPGEKQTKHIKITRAKIEIPTIETEMRKDGIFVIKFYSFSENSAKMFKDALLEFADSKTNKMIIDLRGNPGGFLDSAIRISSWFIEKGEIILSEQSTDGQKPKIYRSYGPKLFTDKLSLVVLVDGGSASASEIMAGALKSHGVAKLVGEKTFGKGSVQELVKITEDTSLKITVANWLTPDGTSISKQGLTPDYVVKMTTGDSDKEKDPQLEKAVSILLSK